MSKSINKAVVAGLIGRDAETKALPSGQMLTKFSLATEYRYKDKSGEWKGETTWHNIVLWGNESLANHLTKGKSVTVLGRISNRTYEKDGQKRQTSEIVAEDIVLGGQRSTEAPSRQHDVPDEDDLGNVPF